MSGPAIRPNWQEQTDDQGLLLRNALESDRSTVWTAMPGIVQSFDPVKLTCEVQLAIQGRMTNKDGSYTWLDISKLVDCPVVFPSGGGFTLTFPITTGDECLVIFASRCIDNWWASGGHENQQAELRMHDLSDGFVLPGPRSLKRPLVGVATTGVQLRADDGSSNVTITEDGDVGVLAAQDVNVIANGMVVVQAPEVVINGNVTINGSLHVLGDIGTTVIPSVNAHIHTGGTISGKTGPTVPGT